MQGDASNSAISLYPTEEGQNIVRFNQVVVFGRQKKTHLRGETSRAAEILAANRQLNLRRLLNVAHPLAVHARCLPM